MNNLKSWYAIKEEEMTIKNGFNLSKGDYFYYSMGVSVSIRLNEKFSFHTEIALPRHFTQ